MANSFVTSKEILSMKTFTDLPTGKAETIAPRQRRHPCWIESFTTATAHLNSPKVFRRWAAIASISATIQRKVWFRFNGTKVYLPLYVVLVGGPGVGKSVIINGARQVVSPLTSINYAHSMGSKEKLIHSIAKMLKPIPEANNSLIFQCACTAFIPELAVFIRPKDIEMINVLLDLYDCQNFRYETLSREPAFLENPYFSILAGTTPAAFADNIARPYAGTGIVARCNIIYSDEATIPEIFSDKPVFESGHFVPDMKAIHSLYGEMVFDGPARRFVQEQANKGVPPCPTDARLAEYLPRRLFHWMKLCCLVAISRHNELQVRREDAEQALEWFLEAEARLTPVIASFGASPVLKTLQGTSKWIEEEFKRTRKPISEVILRRKLLEEVAPQYINQTIAELVASGTIDLVPLDGKRFFGPATA
jgi:hypothetical protein